MAGNKNNVQTVVVIPIQGILVQPATPSVAPVKRKAIGIKSVVLGNIVTISGNAVNNRNPNSNLENNKINQFMLLLRIWL